MTAGPSLPRPVGRQREVLYLPANGHTVVLGTAGSGKTALGYPDHVCCSIQYPNAWYFKRAREIETLFRDWVVLVIDARYLWHVGTKFCPRNAAARMGRLVSRGAAAFEDMFADAVEGSRTYRRGRDHPDFLPTDEQAEILIPDCISCRDVKAVFVRDDEQAAREVSRLELQGLPVPRIVIVPEFFQPNTLSKILRRGQIPLEREYQRGGADA